MTQNAKFTEVALSSIRPEGWLRRFLEIQRDGLTGHLEAAGYPYNTAGWASSKVASRGFEDWAPYEQNAYWVDGMIRCGRLLRDEFLVKKAKKQIDYVLNHADRDGYLGPEFLKEEIAPYPGMDVWRDGIKRWPHVVFFRAMMAEYSFSGDEAIVKALAKHYLTNSCSHSMHRNVCNVEIILWVYSITGDKRLLKHAVEAYEQYNSICSEMDTTLRNMRSKGKATEHGVTYNEIAKLGAILFMYTGKRHYLAATVNAYRKLDRDHMLIDGVHSSSESLAGNKPLASHETCDITDYSWSLGYLLMATGGVEYADKIERACFNAALGAVRKDFRGLQYFSCANQVVAACNTNHNDFFRGEKWMSYRPNPGTECCPGDVQRIMPDFASRMWMRGADGGLAAVLYGPSRITAKVGRSAQDVTIVEETTYPFSERIDFQIRAEKPVAFPLHLRIPCWCEKASLLINGAPVKKSLRAGTFFRINRTFDHNDRITLVLTNSIKLSYWPEGGVGVERGPLVYALRIEEDWRVDGGDERSTPEFPAWNLYPASAWNYALVLDEKNPERSVEVVHRPVGPEPWSIENAPVELIVPARKVKGWGLVRKKSITQYYTNDDLNIASRKVKGDFIFTPPLPDKKTLKSCLSKKIEMVRLIPYGCTHLRLTVFPKGYQAS